MGVRRAACLGTALCALLLVLAPQSGAAAARRRPSGVRAALPPVETVAPSGQIVYAWEGAPGRGCARVGVCGVRGTLVIVPQATALVFAVPLAGAHADVLFSTVSATVRVQEGALSTGGTCVDQVEGDVSDLSLDLERGGAVRAGFDAGASSGHCAGPLAQDLAGLLIKGRRTRSRNPTYDLRATLPFGAGPFSGTLTSTLVLRPHPASGGLGGFVVSSGSGSSTPTSARQRLEQVDLTYRVSAPASRFTVAFGGERGPYCAALDSCHTSGSVAVAFPRLLREIDISAVRAVRAPVSRRQTLRDLRAGKLELVGPATVSWVAPRLSETYQGAGVCSDSIAEPALGLGFGSLAEPSKRSLPVTVSAFNGIDALRTHCPGPEGTDAIGPEQVLMSARIPVRALLRRHLTLTLRAHGGFIAAGYDGTRSGELRLTLSLLRVSVSTETETVITS
jgi:hypothetical protein